MSKMRKLNWKYIKCIKNNKKYIKEGKECVKDE